MQVNGAAKCYNRRMAKRDLIHDAVKNALIKDEWQITHDPLYLSFGIQRSFVDLGAERFIAATRHNEKIAVEVKSFAGKSLITELEKALGQYLMYRTWLGLKEKDRATYLAIDIEAYQTLFEDISGRVLIEEFELAIIVVDTDSEEIVQWIK